MSKIHQIKEIIDVNLEYLDISIDTKSRLREKARKRRGFVMKKYSIASIVVITVIVVLLTSFYNSKNIKIYAKDLMEGIIPEEVQIINLSSEFNLATLDFSIELFKHAYQKDKNSLVSPVSVYLALGMTANGADGETLQEFEKLLGGYNFSIEELNRHYYTLAKSFSDIEKGSVNIANSVWYGNEFDINKNFLQVNADYYGADAFKVDFNSSKAINGINNWVKNKTQKNINKIVDTIDPDTIMYLINSIYFEAEWEEKYAKRAVRKGEFYIDNNNTISVDFMHSNELEYLRNDIGSGFMKNYKNGRYGFVALLPDEGISIDSYVEYLTAEVFLSTLKNRLNEEIGVAIPKFKSEYEINLVETLEEMGLKKCFSSQADFSKMGENNIFLQEVFHKTFIQIDENGTKASAATKNEVYKSLIMEDIIFDRPFVYAIIDIQTNLPLFIGTMIDPS
ncbi:UNVERIFIED_CONTAM: serpin B [Acetivibrio alkalicellulosi]